MVRQKLSKTPTRRYAPLCAMTGCADRTVAEVSVARAARDRCVSLESAFPRRSARSSSPVSTPVSTRSPARPAAPPAPRTKHGSDLESTGPALRIIAAQSLQVNAVKRRRQAPARLLGPSARPASDIAPKGRAELTAAVAYVGPARWARSAMTARALRHVRLLLPALTTRCARPILVPSRASV